MGKIILTRGIQASGKTTWAKQMVASNPNNIIRVSRDDIRFNMFGKYDSVDEGAVTEIETAAVRAGLRADKVVIVDAMHLQQKYINRWQRMGYPVEIREFPTILDLALARNAGRDKKVPDHVIKENFRKFTTDDKGTLKKVKLEPDKFVTSRYPKYDTFRNTDKPEAFIFDIDGTLAHNDGHRSFYDYTKTYGDKVHYHVAATANDLGTSHHVIIVSGRKAQARKDTERWLDDHVINHDGLFMREDGDDRPDAIVKYEILRDDIAPHFDVIGVFDDRPSVCEMWRAVGIPTFQVGDPDNRF